MKDTTKQTEIDTCSNCSATIYHDLALTVARYTACSKHCAYELLPKFNLRTFPAQLRSNADRRELYKWLRKQGLSVDLAIQLRSWSPAKIEAALKQLGKHE